MASVVYPRAPLLTGGGRVLPSPSEFYLTGEDRLRLLVANAVVGVVVTLQWRTATPKADTVPSSQRFLPTSDRLVTTQDYELGEGSLLNVTVFASGGAPRIGQTFVMVQLVRGRGPAAIVLGTLLAGYITATQALGFPGSPIQSSIEGGGCPRGITGTTPAPGAEQGETVPTGARWAVNTWYAQLTTSAVAGNRSPILVVGLGGFPAAQIGFPSVTPASSSGTYLAGQGLPLSARVGAAPDQCGLPIGVQLSAGDQIGTSTSGLQAGDQYAHPLFNVIEWLEV